MRTSVPCRAKNIKHDSGLFRMINMTNASEQSSSNNIQNESAISQRRNQSKLIELKIIKTYVQEWVVPNKTY